MFPQWKFKLNTCSFVAYKQYYSSCRENEAISLKYNSKQIIALEYRLCFHAQLGTNRINMCGHLTSALSLENNQEEKSITFLGKKDLVYGSWLSKQ